MISPVSFADPLSGCIVGNPSLIGKVRLARHPPIIMPLEKFPTLSQETSEALQHSSGLPLSSVVDHLIFYVSVR
jgi:hypothetical protein